MVLMALSYQYTNILSYQYVIAKPKNCLHLSRPDERLKCISGIRRLLVVHKLTLKFVACQRPVAIAHFQVSRCHGCNGAASHLQVWGHVHLSRCICHRAANLVSTSARRCWRLTSHWQAAVRQA